LCCWCCSWVCDIKSLLYINLLLKDICPIVRSESEQTERYMGKILKMLNNNISYAIESGVESNNDYNCHCIDPRSDESKKTGHFFIKRAQQKTEKTI